MAEFRCFGGCCATARLIASLLVLLCLCPTLTLTGQAKVSPCIVPKPDHADATATPDREKDRITSAEAPLVWTDPGPSLCPQPSGLDAGLCVRTYPLNASNEKELGSVRCLPSFLIIGVQKAGTRELRNWLHAHPNLTGHSAELGYLDMVGCTRESDRRGVADENKATAATICNHGGGPVTNAMLIAAEKSRKNHAPKTKNKNKIKGKNEHYNPALYHSAFNESNPIDNRYFWRGYLDRFPIMDEMQRRTQLIFEKTPKYVEMATSRIVRLHQTFPSMKMLLVLRDPVARAYSWYNMACMSKGSKTFGSRGFAEILEGKYKGEVWAIRHKVEKILGLTRSSKLAGMNRRSIPKAVYKWRKLECSAKAFERYILQGFYNGNLLNRTALTEVPQLAISSKLAQRSGALDPLVRGHYADQLNRWTNIFPREQLHVLTMDDLLKNSVTTMQEIESFLQIPKYPYASHFGISQTGTTIFKGVHSKIERPYKARVEPMTNVTNSVLQKYFGAKHDELLRTLRRDNLPWPP
jgi:hypothetical protein